MVTNKLSFGKRTGGACLKVDGKGTSINRTGRGNKAIEEDWEGRKSLRDGRRPRRGRNEEAEELWHTDACRAKVLG